MKNYFNNFIGLLFVLLLAGCSSETGTLDESSFEFDFYPLQVGKYLEYQVDSIIYDNQGTTTITSSSFVREELVETFVDEVGDTVYRVDVLWRSNGLDQWTLTDVWSIKRVERSLVRTEENLKFVKLVFPPETGKEWDGNVFLEENLKIQVRGELLEMFKLWEQYQVTSRGFEEIKDQAFEDVVVVTQVDDQTGLERRFSEEKFVKGIGLVERTVSILDTQCLAECADDPWESKAEKGFTLRQWIIGFN